MKILAPHFYSNIYKRTRFGKYTPGSKTGTSSDGASRSQHVATLIDAYQHQNIPQITRKRGQRSGHKILSGSRVKNRSISSKRPRTPKQGCPIEKPPECPPKSSRKLITLCLISGHLSSLNHDIVTVYQFGFVNITQNLFDLSAGLSNNPAGLN